MADTAHIENYVMYKASRYNTVSYGTAKYSTVIAFFSILIF